MAVNCNSLRGCLIVVYEYSYICENIINLKGGLKYEGNIN